MNDVNETIQQIKDDPRLLLLSQALNEIAETVQKQDAMIKGLVQVLEMNKIQFETLVESFNKMGEAVKIITNQMCSASPAAMNSTSFRGIIIK